MDLSELVYSWLVQSVYLLASMEHEGILHRDIKPDHLFINSSGCLGLVDWGLSSKHADNQYLTQYMFTYLYRPPELYYYGLPLYEK
jgi:serine/threonine protein kinase